MKQYLLVALAAALTACGSSDSGQSGNAGPKKDIQIQPFTSVDRAFADVRGDVQECMVVTRDMEPQADSLIVAPESLTTILTQRFDPAGYIAEVRREDSFLDQRVGLSVFRFEFDANGELKSSSTELDGRFAVKRNGDGYVTSFTSINNTGDKDYTNIYTWDGDRLSSQRIANDYQQVDAEGNPIPVPADKTTYSYDDKGYLVAEHEESGDPSLQITLIDTEYTYLDYDSLGNWIDRNVMRTARVYEMAHGKRALTDSLSTYQREQRIITYSAN